MSELDDVSFTLLEHLLELRTRLVRTLLVFLAGFAVCFFFSG